MWTERKDPGLRAGRAGSCSFRRAHALGARKAQKDPGGSVGNGREFWADALSRTVQGDSDQQVPIVLCPCTLHGLKYVLRASMSDYGQAEGVRPDRLGAEKPLGYRASPTPQKCPRSEFQPDSRCAPCPEPVPEPLPRCDRRTVHPTLPKVFSGRVFELRLKLLTVFVGGRAGIQRILQADMPCRHTEAIYMVARAYDRKGHMRQLVHAHEAAHIPDSPSGHAATLPLIGLIPEPLGHAQLLPFDLIRAALPDRRDLETVAAREVTSGRHVRDHRTPARSERIGDG